MIIITVFICLLAERFLGSLSALRGFTWLHYYSHFILKNFTSYRFHHGKVTVLFIVLPPALLVQLIDNQLSQTFLPLEFAFAIGVLLYCLGPQPFYDRYKALCNNEDKDCTHSYAEQLLDRPLSPDEKDALPHVITQSLFSISNDRIFAPIFWFVLIGPLGAMLFRCSSQLYLATLKAENADNQYQRIAYSAGFLYAILNWAPSRLSAFGFAAMGDFSSAMKGFSTAKSLFQIDQQNNELLLRSIGSGAINLPNTPAEATIDKIPEALAILRRNMQLWMGAIALLTLSGWIN